MPQSDHRLFCHLDRYDDHHQNLYVCVLLRVLQDSYQKNDLQ
jgi:hypothetical protein